MNEDIRFIDVHFSINLCIIPSAQTIDSTEFPPQFRNLNRMRCLTTECTVVLIHGTKRIPMKIQMLNS